MKKGRIIFLLAGCIVLFFLFYSFGIKKTIDHILEMGVKFWIIIVIYLFNNICLAYSWKLVLNRKFKHPGFLRLFLARVAGDTTASLNAMGSIAGEPIKALYIKDEVPFKAGLASVVIDRTVHTIANILIVICGLVLSLFFLDIPVLINIGTILVFAVVIWVIIKILKKQREGLIEYVLKKLPKRILDSFMNEKRREKVRTLDAEIGHIFQNRHTMKRFWIALTVQFLSILISGTLEVYFILRFIGSPVLPTDSVFIYVFGLFFTSVMFFMPANLGTSEGSYSLALKFMGYDPALGLSLGIIRRLRSFVWSGIGVLILFHAGLLKKESKEGPS